MAKFDSEKSEFLADLLNLYKKEVDSIYGVGFTWQQLKNDAKDKCNEDFDHAIIARETYLEELLILREIDIDTVALEKSLNEVDRKLLEHSKIIKDIYGLDVKAYLNVKRPKGLLKSGK